MYEVRLKLTQQQQRKSCQWIPSREHGHPEVRAMLLFVPLPQVRINYSLGFTLFLVCSLKFFIFPLRFSSKVVCHSNKAQCYIRKKGSLSAPSHLACVFLCVFPLPVIHGVVASVDALCLCLQGRWGGVLLNYPVLHVSHSDVSMISRCLANQLHTVYPVMALLADEG